MKKGKRSVDIVVVSDIHLGTYGCHARELLHYLKSIKPKVIILNGDIIDIWQFNKKFWPKSHMKVIKHLVHLISKKVKIYYITGNHDEVMRRFSGTDIGSISIVDKLVLDLPCGKKAWFFHGDVFDVTMQHSKWLAKLGAVGYDTLILINSVANYISENIFNKGKLSLSKKIKDSVKSAVSFVNSFEETAAGIAIDSKYDIVVCGHIHKPEMKKIENQHGEVLYLNSGDWIENLTALEYNKDQWNIHYFDQEEWKESRKVKEEQEPSVNELFQVMMKEFNLSKAS